MATPKVVKFKGEYYQPLTTPINVGDKIVIFSHYKGKPHVTTVSDIVGDRYAVVEGGQHSRKVCLKVSKINFVP